MAVAGGLLLPPEAVARFGPTRRRTTRSKRILFLGGTNFVGPHMVRAALERGHEVTLFNRGITNPHLFPDREKLRGNRYPDRGDGLAALATSRTWDAVVDTWQQAPGCVDLTTRMFADRASSYLYVSSIATYRHYREVGMTEDGPLLDAGDHVDSFDEELGYSQRKRAAEQAVERAFGHRGAVLRCTSIGGSNASPYLEAGYWGYRFLAGGPLIAPVDPTAVFQLIDVKDMADFAIRTIEESLGGAFNVVGPEKPLPLGEYLGAWGEATGHRSRIVWIDREFLRERGVRPWEDIRNWIPGDDPEPGFYQLSNERARARGLSYRPLEKTIREGIESFGDRKALGGGCVGMSRQRELELIARWEGREDGSPTTG